MAKAKTKVKRHKKSFLKEVDVTALRKKTGAEGLIVIAFKKGVGADCAVRINTPESALNMLHAIGHVRDSVKSKLVGDMADLLRKEIGKTAKKK